MADIDELLSRPSIVAALRRAWADSKPGTAGGHEEGGFIVQNARGQLKVIRWPKGAANCIAVPPHPSCRIHGLDIVATFHTRPNTGRDHLQEPSQTDLRAVRDTRTSKARFIWENLSWGSNVVCCSAFRHGECLVRE